MSKKVMYISPNGYLGGAERFVLNACLGHLDYGEYQPVILFLNDGELVEICKNKNIETIVLKNKFKLRNILQMMKAIKEANQHIKEKKPDIIHTTMPYAQIFASLIPAAYQVKKVWFQHGPVDGLLDRIASKTQFHHIMFNSKFLKLEHEKANGEINTSFSIQTLGISCEEIPDEKTNKIRNEYLGKNKTILMMAAGRISFLKGYEVVIRALNNLLVEENKNLAKIRFIIVGEATRESDKEYEVMIRELGRRLVDQEILSFVPFQKEITSFYKASDIFVHSAVKPEPFGLVVAEAMLQDTLVVGGNTGGICEILVNEETGISFSSHTENAVKELTSILSEIISSENINQNPQFKKLRENANKKIRNEYSIKIMTDEIESKYRKLNRE